MAKIRVVVLLGFLAVMAAVAFGEANQPSNQPGIRGVFERTFASQKVYANPFNEVDVDVIFTRGGESWRVPAFWRGGSKWSVRFAPPVAGDYIYHLEGTDHSYPDLNGHENRVNLTAELVQATEAIYLTHGVLT